MTDVPFMRMALRLARKGEGTVNPNPLVGAVVVKDGRVVGRGYHREFGGPHAEVFALDQAGEKARGATLYVSLEPCSHVGKTPPCTERILQAGVARVVAACQDPNPLVHGKGVARLRRAGVVVTEGVLAREVERQNEIFFKFVGTGLPFVTLKLAVSLDGRIATRTGDSKWITGEASRREVHRLRRRHSAVLVGAKTVLADNPRLTVREVPGRNPVRIVLDGKGEIPESALLLREPGRTIVATATMPDDKEKALLALGAEVWRLPTGDARVDLAALSTRLGEGGIDSVLVEGGGETAAAFVEAGLVDRVSFFIAPFLLGGRAAVPAVGGVGVETIAEAIRLVDVQFRRYGEDLLYTGRPERRSP